MLQTQLHCAIPPNTPPPRRHSNRVVAHLTRIQQPPAALGRPAGGRPRRAPQCTRAGAVKALIRRHIGKCFEVLRTKCVHVHTASGIPCHKFCRQWRHLADEACARPSGPPPGCRNGPHAWVPAWPLSCPQATLFPPFVPRWRRDMDPCPHGKLRVRLRLHGVRCRYGSLYLSRLLVMEPGI